jgi:septal ring factor EnvC (AmiA/AmiB activator)
MPFEIKSAASAVRRFAVVSRFAFVLFISARAAIATAYDSGLGTGPIQKQVNEIKTDESNQQDRIEQDERIIRQVQQELQQLESKHSSLVRQTDTLEISNNKLTADTAQLQNTQKQLTAGLNDEQFGSAMSQWLGSHQFTWNGSVSGDFIYDRANNTNTFALAFQPLVRGAVIKRFTQEAL